MERLPQLQPRPLLLPAGAKCFRPCSRRRHHRHLRLPHGSVQAPKHNKVCRKSGRGGKLLSSAGWSNTWQQHADLLCLCVKSILNWLLFIFLTLDFKLLWTLSVFLLNFLQFVEFFSHSSHFPRSKKSATWHRCRVAIRIFFTSIFLMDFCYFCSVMT